MDYDDNDFHSQNFQLAGEESSKFSPGLHSYVLPKFDLDDSLEAHLRFDGLVETEVLLGIQSEEENRWIEDFSRGSGGIEFSSSAAESCSISRHNNNVWSEATSSESVEMLLKSVGQDEMITEQTTVEESDACDKLVSLTNQMEPSLDQDGSISSKMGDADPVSHPNKCLESFCNLSEDVAAALLQVDGTSQAYEDKKSGHGSSRELDPCSLHDENIPLIEEKSFDTNKGEGGPFVDVCINNRIQDAFTTEMGNSYTVKKDGKLNDVDFPQQVNDVSYDNADSLQKNDEEKAAELHVANKESQINDKMYEGNVVEIKENDAESSFSLPLVVNSKPQTAEENIVAASIIVGENSFGLATKEDNVVQGAEGCSNDLCSDNPKQVGNEVSMFSKDVDKGDKFIIPEPEGNEVETSISSDLTAKEESNVEIAEGSSVDMHSESPIQVSSEDVVVSEGTKTDDQFIMQVSDENAFGISVGNRDNSVSLAVKGDSKVEITEGCCENVCSENVPVSKDAVIGDHIIGTTYGASLVVEGSTNFDGHPFRVSNSSSATCTISEAKVNSMPGVHEDEVSEFDEKQQDFSHNDGQQLESGISVNKAETSLLIVEDKILESQRDANGHVGDLSNSTTKVCSNVTQASECVSDGHDGLAVYEDGCHGMDNISPSMQVECTEIFESSKASSGPSDVNNSHPDMLIHEKGNAVFLTESVNMKSDTDFSLSMDKMSTSAPLGDNSAKIEAIAHGLSSDHVAGDVRASSGAVIEDTNTASCEKLHCFNHLLSGENIATDDVIGHEHVKAPLGVEDLTHQYLAKKEECVSTPSSLVIDECSDMRSKPGSLVIKESAMTSKPVHLVDVEEVAFQDNAEQIPCDTVSISSSSFVTVSATSQDDHRAVVANQDTPEYSKELIVCHVSHDPTLRENNNPEVLISSPEKDILKIAGRISCSSEALTQVAPLPVYNSSSDAGEKDQYDNEASLISGDGNYRQSVPESRGDAFDVCEDSKRPAGLSECNAEFHVTEAGWSSNSEENNSGSPAIITCSKSSKNDKENQEAGEASLKQNIPVSDEGSPTVIACSKSFKGEKESQEEARVYLEQNVPVSDNIDGAVNEIGSFSQHTKETDASEGDRSFTFEVSSVVDLSERENDKGWKPFSCTKPYDTPQTLESSPSATSGLCQLDSKMLEDTARGRPQVSDGENFHGNLKVTAEHKTRRLSCKSTEKGPAKEGKPSNEMIPAQQMAEKGGNSCIVSPSSQGTLSQIGHTEEVRSGIYVEGSGSKACGVPSVQASHLPDLNTSFSPSAIFQQPFTDIQQVQLRAQIFVYGSLIQGTAPDEACMISAFGESDGGRSVWENVWRVSVERLHNQKSPFSIPETPLHLRSGARAPEQATGHNAFQISTPVGRAGGKGLPSAIMSPVIPLSSPLWSIPTSSLDGLHSNSMPRSPLVDTHQMLSSLYPYQSPLVRNYSGQCTSWISQSPSPGPWVVSQQVSALDATAHCSALPITEAVHVSSVRESSAQRSSGVHHVPTSSLNASVYPVANLQESKRMAKSPAKRASSEMRSRKRKKSPASEELSQISSLNQTEPVSGVGASSHLSTSVAITTPAFSLSKSIGSFVAPVTVTPSTHYPIIGHDTAQGLVLSEETSSKIEQARLQAEDASALAAAAVKHSQGVWSQLASQKNAGLVSDNEFTIASAAVAAAAAASVAKAAATAARVASNAALQAKMMADEVLVSSRAGNSIKNTEGPYDGVGNLGRVMTASILKGKDRTNNSSAIIVAAREAARRRVEAASAATKRAENLDAIVKAAELTAEAVSQAGTIIGMGDPVPLKLTELLEAGPEGYWKAQASSEHLVKSKNMDGVNYTMASAEGAFSVPAKQMTEKPLNVREIQNTCEGTTSCPKFSTESVENQMGFLNGMHWDPVTSVQKVLRGDKGRASDLAKTIVVVPESETGLRPASISVHDEGYEGCQPIEATTEHSIKEGSTVEVLSDKDGVRRVWFKAKVLSLKDGKAHVCYSELLSDEEIPICAGSGKLEEWVALEGEGGGAPRIRIACPMTAMKFEGTRKRHREARGDYTWSLGDRVDAWIHDGWWEGVITEISKDDETVFTVRFPAQGDTSIVKAWHLRSSLIWKDGQWVEWSQTSNSCCSIEGDNPREKRPRLGSHVTENDPDVKIGGKKKSNNMTVEELERPEESNSLKLSAHEKVFNVGKNIREENNNDPLRMKRTGLQKEGSRVIFGVPKPGKKRKFMDVSKHYVADRSGKINNASDSIKFAKYLIPQGSTSRASKFDSKEKRAAELKPKVPKSAKPRSVPTRNILQKDSSSSSVVSALNSGSVQDQFSSIKPSVGHDEKMSVKQNLIEVGSVPDSQKETEGPMLFSSMANVSDAPSRKKSAVQSDRLSKGKVAPSVERLSRTEEKDTVHTDNPGKSFNEAVEPRRSNRRIQPTSRLLEGLQSSLIISKMPAVSHDKGSKAQHRSTSSSRGNKHG